MIRAAITAVGHYVPEEILTNAELEKLVETNDEWIRSRTGIRERRILRDPDKAASFMAAECAKELLHNRGIGAEEVDAIIVATVTPDMFFPPTASLVQKEIGATKAWGFDLSAACSGFLFALTTGAGLVESGRYQKVMVIGADHMSRIVDYTDRSTCILFGDAAAGVLLEADIEGNGLMDTIHRTDGNNWEYLCMLGGGSLHPPSAQTIENRWHYIRQEGQPVFKLAVKGMANAAAEIMERNNLSGEDVSWLVPHQANLRIIDATARRMGLSMEKVMLNIERYGNTTAATIPLCLYEWQPQLRKGENLVLAAFGGGFTWGASYLKWAYDPE
ncbi:MAG TPA: beta-ketoacyl-ACP synthase III [Rhodothermales bacterium]|nr:beta-ketoacyl-ACP synthase III [Rhodothermales bacterium]HRR09548.1 beta-ketoacyl-ACP synthase III [Rhodothermales bacterium]